MRTLALDLAAPADLQNALNALRDPCLPDWRQGFLEERARRLLLDRARELIRLFNREVGMDALYLLSCATMWVLYGRTDEEDADKRLLYGARELSELLRLVARLEKGINDIAKERLKV